MCVSHYEDSKRAERWIGLLLVGCILFSLGVATPMFILTYPGDECLLFVSVRGEALIYGNPSGCNFIAYGHCFVLIFGKLFYFISRPSGGPNFWNIFSCCCPRADLLQAQKGNPEKITTERDRVQ